MTGFLVVLGLVALVAAGVTGFKYRKQVLPVLNWLWNSVLFLGSFTALWVTVVLALVAVGLTMGMVGVSMVLLGLSMVTVLLYVPVWCVALVIWAISRKRDAFDKVNQPVGFVVGRLFAGIEFLFNGLDNAFDLLDRLFDSLDGLFNVVTASGKVAAAPFLWVSRKLWPRG